jgi:RNA polymerase sigma-B factor
MAVQGVEQHDRSALSVESSSAWEQDLESLPRAERTRMLLAAAAASTSPSERTMLEERVIETNLVIAEQLAARYRKRGVPDDDLTQVAFLGLVKAARRYEYQPDRDFLSFAVPTIRGELRKYFRDLGWTIRPTRRVQEGQSRITRAEGELFQRLGRSPRPSEIAEHLDLDLDLVIEALAANGCFAPSSLESTMRAHEGHVSASLGKDEAGFDIAEARVLLKPLFEHLTDRERLMLEMRFFRGATQSEIGEAIGVTQMQVSRLLADLMARLRKQLESSTTRDQPRQPRPRQARRPHPAPHE